MARHKVNLAYIQDNTARKVSYKKRVRGLMKKANELNVLCGIDVCALVYTAYDNAPVVYPSSDAEVRRILMAYLGRSEMDLAQRKLNHKEFLKQSVTKSGEKLKRVKLKNKETEMENVTSELLTGKPIEQVPYYDLDNLVWVIENRLRAVEHTIRNLEGPNNAADPAVNPAKNLHNSNGNEMVGGSETVSYETQAGQWFPSHQSVPAFLSGSSNQAGPFHQASPSLQAGPSHQYGPSHPAGLWYSSHYQHQP